MSLTTTPTNALTATLVSSLTLTSGAEISAFDPVTDRLFVTSNSGLQVVDFTNPRAPVQLATIDFVALGLGSNDVSSVAYKNGVLAAAIIASDKTQPGTVAFIDPATGGLLKTVTVGANPDNVTFTPDGLKVLVANEGEIAANGTDPDGSVSIIDISDGVASATVQTATFNAFNGQEAALRAAGVRLFEGKTVSQDVEPEYIAVSPDGTKAMVTLQEANSVALLDIATATFTDIVPLGLKDFSTLLADYSDRDGPGNTTATNLVTGMPVFGLYMPDAIASFTSGGRTYYVMANEGDDRDDFLDPGETIRVNAVDLDDTLFPNEAALKGNSQLGRLTISNAPGANGDTDGDGDVDQILVYGARSFSIVDQNGNQVFDSADIIERIVASGATDLVFDDTRSDNKGPEPEGISVATVGGRTYAFVALERAHGTMVFDVTDPADVTYTTTAVRVGDLNPEGLLNISAADSPTGQSLLVVSNEVSNTISTFGLTVTPAFTLQLLHLSDGEAGLLAGDTAPNLAALVDAFDDLYANTLILSGGDNFLPGPFLNAGTDPSLNSLPAIGATAPARPDIAILNAIGIETSAIGNHEFDLGSTAFRDAFTPSGAWGGALFPYLSANLDFSGDSALLPRFTDTLDGGTATLIPEASSLKGRIAPAAVVTEGGEKIGIIGATTQVLEAISSPNGTEVKGFPTGPGANGEHDDMDLLAAQLQPIIDEMIAEGINKIVVTSHLQNLDNERLLATKLHGVDIILSAGSHTRLGDANDVPVALPGHDANFADTYPIVTQGTDGKTTLIVGTDGEYTYLGRLVVDFDADGNIIVENLDSTINGAYASTAANVARAWGVDEAELETTAFAEGTKGDQVRDITQAVDTVIAAKDGTIYGYTNVYLEGDRTFGRAQEVNLGNITADANAWKAQTALGLGDGAAVVSLKNGGGIRAQIGSIDPSGDKIPPIANPDAAKPAGAISQLDIENALRFDNKLMVFDTTPQGLVNILAYGTGLPAGNGGYPQLGGVRVAFDNDLPEGSRVRDVALVDLDGNVVARIMQGGVILPDAPALISAVALNFTANGGDGYPIKANATNFRYLLADGSVSAAADPTTDFTAAAGFASAGTTGDAVLGEQKAFADFLTEFHGTPATAYDVADTPRSEDLRIEDLNVRTSAVFGESTTVDGTAGADHLYGLAGDDTISGLAGNDTIYGLAGNDTLNGGADDDKLLGGTGADIMAGGTGNDRYYVDNAGDQVIEAAGEGTDNVYSTVDYTLAASQEVEFLRVYGGATGLTLTGNELDNYLVGGSGSDTLNGGAGDDTLLGGAGADIMAGGTGNDRYYVDNADDQVIEAAGEGTDNVYAAVDYTLAAGQEVEFLRVYGGAMGLTLTGNELDNYLIGGAGGDTLNGGDGDDTLLGGAGADIMTGGAGNDRYYVDNADDQVIEAAGEGTDHVYTTVDYTLAAGQEIESLRVYGGTTGLTLAGNEFDNYLIGGAGSDTLNGGAGNDTLLGGAQADTFAFSDGWGNDTVADFENGLDLIDLHDLSAPHGFDQLAIVQIGANVMITLDGVVGSSITIRNTLVAQIDQSDFIF